MADTLYKAVFSDENLEAITCESTWHKRSAQSAEIGCQTKDIHTADAAVMSRDTDDVGCQTDDNTATNYSQAFDEEVIASVKRAARIMLEELSRPQSQAFNNYQVSWEEELDCMSCLLTMNQPVGSEPAPVRMPVTSLSWNCTGSVLAASFGHTDHSDWCLHKSSVALWNIGRHEKQAAKPDNSVDVDGCAMCVQFHPSRPGLLAAGMFSGDLLVWDLAQESESGLLLSDSQDDIHKDSITNIHWLKDKLKTQFLSVSASGRVNVWIVNNKKKVVTMQASRVVQAPAGIKLGLKADWIGTSIATFDPEDDRTFLMGTETGGLYKCTRETDNNNAVLAYRANNGPIYGIQFSQLNRNFFISCGTDSCIQVYSALNDQPLLSLEPCQGYLYSARWSPIASSVLAVGGSRGKVVFYDLSRSLVSPWKALETSQSSVPVQAVEFNHKQTNLIACGDAEGTVKVWVLDSDLTRTNTVDLGVILADGMGKEN